MCSWNLLHNKEADSPTMSQSLATVKLEENPLVFMHRQCFQVSDFINKTWNQEVRIPGFHD